MSSGGPLGAWALGIDLGRPQPDSALDEIRSALLRYHLLVFPEQQLSPERLLEIGRWFGDLYEASERVPVLGDASQPLLVTVSNDAPNGVLGHEFVPPHSDLKYTPVPPALSLLHAVQVPRRGGDTAWANLHLAYDELDDATKQEVRDLRIYASNPYGREGAARGLAGPNQRYTDEELPHFLHPLVRTHPVTGRKLLYVCHFPGGIVGIEDPSRSERLLARLRRHVDQPRFYYTHRWRPRDLIIWDNRCTNHRRERFPASQTRLLYRVQTAGLPPR